MFLTFNNYSVYEEVWSYLYRIGADFAYNRDNQTIDSAELTDSEINSVKQIAAKDQ